MRALITACFKRPVTVTAFYLLLVVMAVTAYIRLPVALLPEMRYPTLVVWTAYPDVPPDRVERGVTHRLEEAVAGTQGIRRITSRSMLGGSMIRLDFGWNTDLDYALLDVREQIDKIGESLPQETERPIVLRLDPNDRPIMVLALSESLDRGGAPGGGGGANSELADGGSGTNPGDVLLTGQADDRSDLVGLKMVGREVIARRLEQLRDVARVVVTGGFERRIDVTLDPARLAAYDIDITTIDAALRSANSSLQGGSIRRGPFRYAVEVTGEFETIDDISNAIVAWAGDSPIRLRQVGEVREGVDERRGMVRYDGRETLMLLVERRPEANTVRAAEEIRIALAELDEELTDVQVDLVVDESEFIEQAIGGVTQAVLLGGLLAVIVLFVFLRRKRALIAVAVAVPLSLAITLVAFEFLDVTFNLISLSGLALGVGMLVDNAIVVVENIARVRDNGLSQLRAGIEGTSEVAGAITASTLTTIAVFLPLTFVEGLAGRLFLDQSLAVVASLLASLMVGLTVVPLIAAYTSGSGAEGEGATGDESGAGGEGEVDGKGAGGAAGGDAVISGEGPAAGRAPTPAYISTYEGWLSWCLDRRSAVVVATVVLLAAAFFAGGVLPREVVPQSDQGRLDVHLTLPADSDLPLIDQRAQELSNTIRRRGGVAHILADLGERDEARLQIDPRPTYEGSLTLILEDESRVEDIARDLQTLQSPSDVSVEVRPVRTQLEELIANEEADVFIDLTSERRELAMPVFEQVLDQLQQTASLANVRVAEDFEVPAYNITFDREQMSRFGVTSNQLTAYLEASARGRESTELRTVNDEIPITLRASGIGSIEELLRQRIPARGQLMPIGSFVSAQFVMLPASLIRTNQAPVLRILADVAPGADLARATRDIERILDIDIALGVRGSVGGANEAFTQSLDAVLWSLLLSLLLVFLILAAQFESLVQPFVILLAVPLAASGVVLVLMMTGQSINLMSLTGSVVLVGIVVNDAIVKVDFINQRRRDGMLLRQAVMDAGRDRLRPILMTTITTVFGLLPLALGFGEGAELRAPMAIAITGGLTAATVLTLFVVPVFYTFVAREPLNVREGSAS